MRSIGMLLYYGIVFIISIPLFLLVYLIGKWSPRRMHAFCQGFVSLVFKGALFLAGTDYHIVGLEGVPKDKPVLYVANHRGFFDVVITYAFVPGLTSYIAKKEIKKAPGIAQWMYFLRCFFLDRSDLREGMKMILFSIERIKEGYSIYISPEGTRNATDALLPFKEGSFKIAQKTGCLIVPVILNNTESIFEAQFPWIKRAKVWVEFAEPIDPNTLDAQERKFLGAHVREIIQVLYEKNQGNI